MLQMDIFKSVSFENFIVKNALQLSIRAVALIIISLGAKFAYAGFVEMPDTKEAPELERHSLLLDLDIPAVRDRDPDPQAGPRLNVKEFRIQGLIEYPRADITREKIIKQVEAIRFDLMGEGKMLSSGYTIDEIGQVSDLVAEIEQSTEGEHVGPLEVQKLVFLIREQRRQRGITLGMIEAVADTITRYYRERGFILAKAYIPKQQVRDGIVTLTILLGELGEVDVHNNKRYSSNSIKRVFKNDYGNPITNDGVEEKLYLLNDLPGLSVQGYFEPGSQVGDTKFNVNVTGEKWYDASVRLDNHGAERSGKNRAFAQFQIHNPTTLGDQIDLSILQSYSPQNSTYGAFAYTIPVVTPRLKFSLGASTNDFVLGSGNKESAIISNTLTLEGKSTVFDSSLRYQIERSRVTNYSAQLKFMRIASDLQIGDTKSNQFDNIVENYVLSFDYDRLNEKKRVLQQANIAVISSNLVDGGLEGQEKNPTILTADYSRLSFINIPFTKYETRLVLRFSGQYSGKSLGSVNQWAMGGPTRMRGFAINEYYADDAGYVSADWIFKGPSFNGYKIFGEKLESMFQPFVFADAGYGKVHSFQQSATLDDSTKAELADIGVGLKLGYTDHFRGNIMVAKSVKATNTALTEDIKPDRGINTYIDLQYSF
ncbi:MAG: ShlB/FhaC/HecB family hemolysin secretion/activation protein [Gammaproteobacteria bacterium]|nr:MAG: ShlB/FhaC/HecB family hemolysin secretion/activation protein [Gammaproteobacteria bacterium]